MEWMGTLVQLLFNLSDNVSKLVQKFFSWVQSEVSLAIGVEEELGRLGDTKERIHSLLRDVELWRRVTEGRILDWLADLKDVALDAEDLAEEFETWMALQKPPAGRGRKRKRWYNDWKRWYNDWKRWYNDWKRWVLEFLFRYRVAKQIVEITNRYDEISKKRKELLLTSSEAPLRSLPAGKPPTSALIRPEALQILGREAERNGVVDLLLEQPAGPAELHVVTIYGEAGIGKTALSKYVYNDERVAQRFNNKRIWICIDRGFDVVKITGEILQSLTGHVPLLSNLTALQSDARNLLGREPFLLVLDNVGNVDGLRQHWEALRDGLPVEDVRSRVLITTRSERLAQEMSTMPPFRLNGLSYEDWDDLFRNHAFPDQHLRRNLENIGSDIASKCRGSPLAAISVGGVLSRWPGEEEDWKIMLEEMAAFSDECSQLNIVRILTHSFELLPPHLKKCFAFCALFPPGHQFQRDELIKLWIAQGYIPMGRRRAEVVGSRYFDELVWMSFFQVSDRGEQNPGSPKYYKMSDLLQQVSQTVSKHECVRFVFSQDTSLADVPQRARHLALCCHSESMSFEDFPKHKRLRTLVLQAEPRAVVKKQQLLGDLFPKLTHLRVLDLGNTDISVLPDSVGELLLLRYLSLRNCPIESLPDSVTYLPKLQTLELGKTGISVLPDSIGDLVLLRHLSLRKCLIKRLPESVTRLHNLQTLELGECCKLAELPDSVGELVQLRHLSLYNCPVENLPESVADLRNLQILELGECYNLAKLPDGTSKLVNLQHLGLQLTKSRASTSRLSSMPPGMRELTSLKTLSRFVVGTMNGCGVSELKDLNIMGELWISKLENVTDPEESRQAELSGKSYLKSLTLQWSASHGGEQNVIDCLQPPSGIEHLGIDGYGGATPPRWMDGGSFPALVSLRISNCTGWRFLPSLGTLHVLRELIVEGMHNVERMEPMFPGTNGGGDRPRFPRLEMITLSDFPRLERWNLQEDDVPGLRELRITGFPRLANLPSNPGWNVQVS